VIFRAIDRNGKVYPDEIKPDIPLEGVDRFNAYTIRVASHFTSMAKRK